MIDNRASGGKLVEAATSTCSHCQRQVIRNPARQRPRASCSKCDSYICDQCAATGECRPFHQLIDRLDSRTHKQRTF